MMRAIGSILRLVWIVVHESFGIVADLLRGDRVRAGGRARYLGISIHNDLLLAVAAMQSRLPFWKLPPRDIDRILIVKLDRLGDMVTTTPVFDALKELFPNARLDIVGHPVPLALLEGDPRVGERIPYKSWLYHPLRILPPGLRDWLLVLRLLRRRYALVVYLRGSLPFLLLGLRSRMAATKFIVAEPVITRYLRALEKLFGPMPSYPARLHVEAAARRTADVVLGEGPGPRIVIHAAASAASKIWPAERFAALADALTDTYNARVHFLGSPDERTSLENIVGLAVHRHAVHCSLSIPQVVGVIEAADVFVGNDSGLSHIAAGVGTRAVILWGPANLSMAQPRTAPEDCIILYHDLPCRDTCPEIACNNPNSFECLTRTQVADVAEAAGQLLGLARTARRPLPLLLAAEATR